MSEPETPLDTLLRRVRELLERETKPHGPLAYDDEAKRLLRLVRREIRDRANV